MRVAVIGQGSIGRRHATILLELGHEVTVFDPEPATAAPAGALRMESLDAVLEGARQPAQAARGLATIRRSPFSVEASFDNMQAIYRS